MTASFASKCRSAIAAVIVLLFLSSGAAVAQSGCPPIVFDAVLTAAQWNQCFQNKNDVLGYVPVNKAGDVLTGRIVFPAPSGSFASLNLTPGSAPPGPVNGDVWVTAFGIFAQINGVTVQLTTGNASISPGTTGYPAVYTGPNAIGAQQFIGVGNGGTGVGTPPAARVALNIDEITAVGNASYSILATDRAVATNATFTAPRTWTLPAASSVNAGQIIIITDMAGGVSLSNTLTIARNGADTINGGTSVTIAAAYGSYYLISNGVGAWVALGNVSNVTISTRSGISSSGTCNILTTGNCSLFLTAVTHPQGRLTLQANTPVMTTTQAAQTTLRYDCYVGAGVPYFDGTNDQVEAIPSCEVTDAMVSAASAGQVVSGQVYDVWWVHGGANRICLAMSSGSGGGGGWASDTGGSNTARGTGYTQLDRTSRPYTTNKNSLSNCFNGATNYAPVSANQGTYLGTVAASANGQISWTYGASGNPPVAGLFGVWNMYNRVQIASTVWDTTTGSYTYSSSTPREANGRTTWLNQYVIGVQEDFQTSVYNAFGQASAASPITGICHNSTSAFFNTAAVQTSTSAFLITPSQVTLQDLGLNQLVACEASSINGSAVNFIPSSTISPTASTLYFNSRM